MELIDKSALVAEIEKRIKKYATIDVGNSSELDALYGAKCKALMEILSFLDTIETKEVDLEKELDKYTTNNFWALEGNSESPYLVEKDDMLKIAKHFYKLGLKAQKGE